MNTKARIERAVRLGNQADQLVQTVRAIKVVVKETERTLALLVDEVRAELEQAKAALLEHEATHMDPHPAAEVTP